MLRVRGALSPGEVFKGRAPGEGAGEAALTRTPVPWHLREQHPPPAPFLFPPAWGQVLRAGRRDRMWKPTGAQHNLGVHPGEGGRGVASPTLHLQAQPRDASQGVIKAHCPGPRTPDGQETPAPACSPGLGNKGGISIGEATTFIWKTYPLHIFFSFPFGS